MYNYWKCKTCPSILNIKTKDTAKNIFLKLRFTPCKAEHPHKKIKQCLTNIN